MADKDFSEIARLSERYNKDPRSKMFVQLADAYRKNSMFDEAMEVLNRGLKHHPQYSLAFLIQGKCFMDKRVYDRAKASFEKTITLDPGNIAALRALAQVCDILKDEKGQLAAYKKIVVLDPFDSAAKNKLDTLEAMHRRVPLYTVALAQEYEKQGNLEEALTAYQYLLDTDPMDIILQKKVRELKTKLGKPEVKVEEQKVAGLQFDNLFRPEDLVDSETEVKPGVVGPQEKEPEPIKDFISEPMEIERPKDTGPAPTQTAETKEEVQSLRDFLLEPTAKVEEPKVVSNPPVAEKIVPPTTQAQEPPKIEDFLLEEKPAVPEPEPQTKAEEKIPEQPKPQVVSEKPTPQPTEKPTAPTQPPTTETKEEPKKPKEEDFRSFQEWLSGLLK